MVTGLEASNKEHSRRLKEDSNFYGFGTGKGTLNDVQTVPTNKRKGVIKSLNQKGPSDLGAS